MPSYWPIRKWTEDGVRDRVIDRILSLRTQIREEVPKPGDGSLLLATWNLREFDSGEKHGKRLPESYHYIAEIISAFHLVAIQEVHRDLKGLRKLLFLLGPHWDYVVTDTTEGRRGNDERMAFVFDKRRVSFRNVVGEIVLPKGLMIGPDALQFARTPFMVAFQAGWFKFNLCTVHIYYGETSGAALQRRIEEIRALAKFFARRQKREVEDYILLGDFNIVSPEHPTMQALLDEGFTIPEPLRNLPSNLGRTHYYDQIAFMVKKQMIEAGRAGVFDFRKSVFTDNEYDIYSEFMDPQKRDFYDRGARKGQERDLEDKVRYYTSDWRTFQVSDHMLMWVELKVDFTDAYLNSLRSGNQPLATDE